MGMREYQDKLNDKAQDALDIAEDARSRKADPKPHVEMELAEDIAERCEKLLGIDGLADHLHSLEEEGHSREEIAFKVAEAFGSGELGDYDSKAAMVEGAIRTAVALLTEGVVAAPIDGIGEVQIEENDDGTEFLRIPYFGPIRSAGGTGQALSVLVADYVRQQVGLSEFQPRDDEVERYVEEMRLYDDDTGLQYFPKEKETRHIIRNCPVMVDGVQTTEAEVEGYRDLERIDGNRARGGMCLVVGEGIAQKAPKLKKYTDSLDIEGWDWLNDLSLVTTDESSDEEDDAAESEDDPDEDAAEPSEDAASEDVDADDTDEPEIKNPSAVKPKKKFMADIIAGRPVFAGPSKPGAFRLRYGRARNMGHAACGYHPATMVIADDFLASGTQLKTERPGKAAGTAAVDSIEGPTVRLANGDLRRIDDVEEARRVQNAVEKIVDLGECAVPYGEFLENNHPLVPASYVHEWWVQEYEKAGGDPAAIDVDTLTPTEAFEIGADYDIPLHPKFTYLWHDIDAPEYNTLCRAIEHGEETDDGGLMVTPDVAEVLEALLVPHTLDDDQIVLAETEATVLQRCCADTPTGDEVLDQVQDAAGVAVRERSPMRIGARMGRPEKSARREMSPPVHALFPIGEAGGSQRDIEAAAANSEGADVGFDADSNDEYLGKGVIETTLANRQCPECETELWRARCPDCEVRTDVLARCPECGKTGEEGGVCRRCDEEYQTFEYKELDINTAFQDALDEIGERPSAFDKVKGVKRLSSKSKLPEPLVKGILRAKHDVDVFRDGTSRYDMVDLPLTSFKPSELDIGVEEMKDLGYEEDFYGNPLEDDDQLVEMQVQDTILSKDCGDYLVRVANFIDDLLENYYGMEPYYNANHRDDLIGELVVGLAPHTSAGVMARIVGFSEASVNYAHPFFHAAKRRNCFHPNTTVDYADGDDAIVSTSIKDLFEDQFDAENAQTDDFGAVYSKTQDEIRVASVTDDGETVLKELTHVQRTPAPETLITIETESGRSVTVTPDHDMLVYDADEETLMPKPARFIRADDMFARPTGEWAGDEVVGLDTAAGKYGVFIGGDPDGQEEFGTSYLDPVTNVEFNEPDCEYVYNVTVEDTHTLPVNGLWQKQCDGDEDCVMLFMDGLLNFSKQYLPDKRGKRTMDAPMVLSTVIDPEEIDDEAHNVDTIEQYPLEFYEATQSVPGPKEVDMPIAEDLVEDGTNTTRLEHSLETSELAAGPANTAYKELGSMGDKTESQLALAAKTRAMDERKVANEVVQQHFFPDIIGNLTAFAKQRVRCPACGNDYRRPPLSGNCEACGGNLILTVHEGSVKKYVDISIDISERYSLTNYTKQRLEALEERIDSIFEDDKEQQTGLGDFV